MTDEVATETVDSTETPESFEDAMAALGSDLDGEPVAEAAAAPPAGDEGDPPAADEGEPPADESGEKDDGPGDLRIALRQERAQHRAQMAEINERFEQRFRAMAEHFQRVAAPEAPETPKPTLDENPEEFIRETVGEAVKPLLDGQDQAAQAEDAAAIEDLGHEVKSYVEADYEAATKEYGQEAVTAAIDHVVGEELRGIRARNPGSAEEEIAGHFFSNVLPSLQLHYATQGLSLTEMAIGRAQAAGALPEDLSTFKAPGAEPATAPAAPAPGSRVTSAAQVRPSLSSVPATSPKGEPSIAEILAMEEKQFSSTLGKMGFDDMMKMLGSPTPV